MRHMGVAEYMSKKAQLKIQQMAFMLMAVFLFFILVGMFYLIIQSNSWKRQALMIEKNNAVQVANFLASSAEFTCGSFCIDADRSMVLRGRTAYNGFWKVSSIEIRRIYPKDNQEVLCDEANYPNCNLIKVYESGKGENTAYSFVSLCRRVNEGDYIYYKCELGELIIGYSIE